MAIEKRALVLGGSGFLGSHVADVLSDNGFQVTVFDQRASPYLKPQHRQVIGDILDKELIETEISSHSHVLNFAGIADLTDAKLHPHKAVETNIVGNLNVLEALRKSPTTKYVFASTYYVYSDFGSVYRITKQSCELFIEDYAKRFNLDFRILRYGSLYGDRSDEKNGVYRMLKEAIDKRRIHRQGTGEEVREYIHVADAAKATYEIMLKDDFKCQHVIIAGQQKTKIKELLEMISEIMAKEIDIIFEPAPTGDTDHYGITPYAFKPVKAFRYTTNSYHDLGQGLLSMMYRIHEEREHTIRFRSDATFISEAT